MLSLKRAIAKAGITQKELSRRSGVHPVTISNCSRKGKWPAHATTRNALLRALGLPEEVRP